jgi:hypothetical protein
MNTTRFTPPVLLALTLAAFLAGCQFGKPPALSSGAGGMDMFTPQKMRLHPLSRILPADKNALRTLEARLEFTDQFGDIGKGAGAVYIELFAYESLVPNHHGDRLGIWNFDLSTPQANKEHWDSITRTYLFKPSLPAAALAKRTRVMLQGTFVLPGGARLTDELALSVK